MHSIRQYVALLRMNLAGIPQRLGPVLTILIGVTCAVGVLVSMLAMGAGAHQQAVAGVRDDRVVMLSTGAQSVMQSSIAREALPTIASLPGIRQDAHGKPVAGASALIIMDARKKQDDKPISFALLGVGAALAELKPEMHLTAGRMFQPGLRELIASDSCALQFAGFEIADKRSIRGSDWNIVGHFAEGNPKGQCKVYADAETVMSAFGLNGYNEVTVMLQSAAGYDEFVRALKADPTLHVEAKHEREAVEQEFKQFNGILNFFSYFIGTIMAVAATLGAVNSLYAIVDSRRRDLATLRAIGFGSLAIIASILSESILLALPGALLGGALAWVFFNGLSASPFGVSLQLAVTAPLLVVGITWALAMGLFGGLLPALRAARVPVTTALRAV